MKNILVTGGAGFIGSNFVKLLLDTKKDIYIYNLDLLTYAGNLLNLKEVKGNERYTFIKGDICDQKLVSEIIEKYQMDTIVNFAAESHVDRSIDNPTIFLETNILGTQNLMNCAMKFWRNNDSRYNSEFNPDVKFLQVSTDEVYGSLGKEGLFRETDNLMPNSPYSASKASADLVVRAYSKTYKLPVNITRCSNNYGPFQFPEKLIPLIINNALNEKDIPVYGDGLQIRDWLHVSDHCKGILKVLEDGVDGEVYNIGGNNEIYNIDIVKHVLSLMNKSHNLITFVKDRPGHDKRYAIDNTKITNELGWKPEFDFSNGIKKTVEWYLSNQDWMKKTIDKSYLEYYENMYSNR